MSVRVSVYSEGFPVHFRVPQRLLNLPPVQLPVAARVDALENLLNLRQLVLERRTGTARVGV